LAPPSVSKGDIQGSNPSSPIVTIDLSKKINKIGTLHASTNFTKIGKACIQMLPNPDYFSSHFPAKIFAEIQIENVHIYFLAFWWCC